MDWGVVSWWLPKALPVFGLALMFVLIVVGGARMKAPGDFTRKLGGFLTLATGLLIGLFIIAVTR